MFLNPNLDGGGGGNYTAPSPGCFLPNNSKTVNTVTFQLSSIKQLPLDKFMPNLMSFTRLSPQILDKFQAGLFRNFWNSDQNPYK